MPNFIQVIFIILSLGLFVWALLSLIGSLRRRKEAKEKQKEKEESAQAVASIDESQKGEKEIDGRNCDC